MKFEGKKVAFHTLGCKLNFAETSDIARSLMKAGFTKVGFQDKADVYLINTCSVTENADRECRDYVRRALSVSPEAFVAVLGCYAQLKPQEIAQIPGVDLVLGASEKFNIIQHLESLEKKNNTAIHHCEIGEVNSFVSSYSSGDRTRTFLKVQDGCDYSCTFCTIPLARGQSRSDTIENVLQKTQEIAALGCKEVVLTGINLGDFGYGPVVNDEQGQSKKFNFYQLLKTLDEQSPVPRFRISSIEPNLLSDEIIRLVATSDKIMPHFHIPLQSGSDEILKKMKRRYLSALYQDKVQKIRELIPQAGIGVDVITGFPGETDEHFQETYRFLAELEVSYLHVFTYSERENTEAALMVDKVSPAIRKQRTQMLRALSLKKQNYFYQQQIGKTFPVLWESENKDGWMHGFTSNYVKVRCPYDANKTNQIESVCIEASDSGEIMNASSKLILSE